MEALTSFFKEHLLAITLINIGTFVIFLVATFVIFAHLPRNYWINYHEGKTSLKIKCVRNVLALPVLLMGLLMLLLPGQGLLTILLALMIADFEYKHTLIDKIISKPKIRESLNYIRSKMKRPPFEWPPK